MSCGPVISLATKGVICCGGKTIKQLVTSLCLSINRLQNKLNLKLEKSSLNLKIQQTQLNIKVSDFKINLCNPNTKLNIKVQD